jgi:BirA family biotin operon repressor/biotin-[acetyl-CoA-carboxylase] ligase
LRQAIIELLKEGQEDYLSGEEISRKLGISRTAVWKHINKLKEAGYDIDAVTKRGYKLKSMPDTLLPEEIKSQLNTKVLGQHIYYFNEIDSTNRYCKELGEKKAPEGTLVVAEYQEKGRGRLGRTWTSPARKGLWFSLLLRPKIAPQEASRLTLLTAVAVAEALHKQCNLAVGIKWPNDILINGKKIGGILLEIKAEADQINYLVLGIGININVDFEEFPDDLVQIATSLSMEKGFTLSRVEILKVILEKIEEKYCQYLNMGFGPILNLWKKYNVTLGKKVTVTNWQRTWVGWAEDIDPNGGLVLTLPDGTKEIIYSGDVTLTGNIPK